MSHHCAPGAITVGQPFQGRFTAVACFLHSWITALTVVQWSLTNSFLPFSRLIRNNQRFFLMYSRVSLDLDMCCFLIFILGYIEPSNRFLNFGPADLVIIRPGRG